MQHEKQKHEAIAGEDDPGMTELTIDKNEHDGEETESNPDPGGPPPVYDL